MPMHPSLLAYVKDEPLGQSLSRNNSPPASFQCCPFPGVPSRENYAPFPKAGTTTFFCFVSLVVFLKTDFPLRRWIVQLPPSLEPASLAAGLLPWGYFSRHARTVRLLS